MYNPLYHLGVMNQTMMKEVAIKDRRHQDVGQPAFQAAFLVHELVRIVDANCTGQDANAAGQSDLFPKDEVRCIGGESNCSEDQDKLKSRPKKCDGHMPANGAVRGVWIGILIG